MILLVAAILLGIHFVTGCTSPPSGTTVDGALGPGEADAHDQQASEATIGGAPLDRFARPPFFRISGGEGATILLLGTLHIGPEEGWTFSKALGRALEAADAFIFEVDPHEISEDGVGDLLAELVIIERPKLLDDLVSRETASVLAERDEQLAALGMPYNARKRLKPWYIAMALIESAASRSAWSTAASAESVVQSAIGDRPALGLETFEFQINMLNEIDADLQDMMLRDTVSGIDEAIEDIQAHAEAWRTGDLAHLEALARDGVDEMPGFEKFYEVVLDDRNRRWMPILRALLDEPARSGEVVLVAVGSLHLVGKAGLIALFRTSGYDVTPIDQREPNHPH